VRASREASRRPRARSAGRTLAPISLPLALLAPVAPTPAQTFPKFSSYVVDQANIIPPDEEARLTALLGDFERRTKHQLAIATVPSLQGLPIDTYSLRLARKWGVGRKVHNDGVILLVAPQERKVRIEVGYGLERTLTDQRCAVIIRDRIIPSFKAGNFPAGITAGARAIIARLDVAPTPKMAGR
jgi:uncharacterized protein